MNRGLFRTFVASFIVGSICLLTCPALIHAAGSIDFDTVEEIGDLVTVQYQSTTFNRRTGQLKTNVIVTNTSDQDIQCPLVLVVTSISAPGVTLASADGQTPDGNPFVDLSAQVGDGGTLAPGELTSPLTIIFDNTTRRRFTFESQCLGTLILGPPPAPVLAPHDTMTNANTLEVFGSASQGQSVEVSGPQGTLTVPVVNGQFTTSIPLAIDTVNQIFFTTISNSGVRGPPTATAITQDSQPPNLLIQFPDDEAKLTTATTDVAGTVGDVLSGFVGLTVTVNGVPAIVDVGIGTNGTFFAESVPLNTGGAATVITATATDELGNTVSKQITVSKIKIADDAPRMAAISGNSQEAQVETVLPQPIVARVTNANGTPFPNKIVTFKVTRSNGRLTANGSGDGALMFQTTTDANGNAQAFWKLGTDAGCGNNRVTVTSASIAGTTFFCASGTPAPADQINIGSGNNQRAESGGPAPEPLRVWVSDSCNGVRDVPVTFTVIRGGGTVNGQTELTVNTSQTGHAQVDFILGPHAGNNVVRADFPNNPSNPAEFVIFGVVRNEAEPTTFSGLVLDNGNLPIEGAACSLTVNGQSVPNTVTDASGQFSFNDIPAGPAKLHIDGLVAFGLNGQPIPEGSFPALSFDMVVVPNAVNSLPTPVLLPPLDSANARTFDNTQDVELTVAGMEGLKMIVKAGSMTRADGSVPSPGDPAIIALNQVHFDDVPMPMPDGAAPPFAWTLQPAGAHFDPPVEVHYPNMSGLPAGSITYFLSFDHSTNKFEIIAQGSVSDDGSTIMTDPGSGITVAGWGCNCPPYTATATCCNPVCVETGMLSGGTVTSRRELKPSDLFETITFTASGVTDSGGGKECPDEQMSVAVPPGTVTYRYEVTGPRGFSQSGEGSEVSVLAEDDGVYTCKFFASVDRECPPPEIEVGTANETIEPCTGFMPVGGGVATGRTSFSFSGGQGVRVKVRNLNVLGVGASVDSNFGQAQGLIILPLSEHTFNFSVFGEEPIGWTITFDSPSDAVSVLITIESTWARGCPRNR